jgi:malonate decarboxylase alpha subunit
MSTSQPTAPPMLVEQERVMHSAIGLPSSSPLPSVPSRTEPNGWSHRRAKKAARLARVRRWMDGPLLEPTATASALQELIEPGDKVALEGDNQKQADFLSRALVQVDAARIHDLHLLIGSVSLPEHLTLFERGIARRLDLSYAGPQSVRLAQLLEDGKLEIGAIHTYVELYARMFVDLIPDIALVCAEKVDRKGNLYTGPNTEDTPTIVEAAAFNDAVVVAQANEIVEELPRVDIPASWVDVVVLADRPFHVEPLFTRDPRQITDVQILMAMLVIRGIYERHSVVSLNHGVGFDTAAVELLLPTYGESLGLRGKICRHWVLNPHPTLIPAIETGWVESVCSFGGEIGMEEYTRARPDVFSTGHDGSLRSNRVLAQLAGQYAIDLFIGSTLQMDAAGNSSTVTRGRLAGFGGAPNMGSDPHGRRHPSRAWLDMMINHSTLARGRKLVVQTTETFRRGGEPSFVDTLDAVAVGKSAHMPLAPVMIYRDDVTHVVTEEGIAYLYKAEGLEERRAAIAAVAGATEVGRRAIPRRTDELRSRGIVATPADLGVRPTDARRSLLAARSIDDLVTWSGGLYRPPPKFRSW